MTGPQLDGGSSDVIHAWRRPPRPWSTRFFFHLYPVAQLQRLGPSGVGGGWYMTTVSKGGGSGGKKMLRWDIELGCSWFSFVFVRCFSRDSQYMIGISEVYRPLSHGMEWRICVSQTHFITLHCHTIPYHAIRYHTYGQIYRYMHTKIRIYSHLFIYIYITFLHMYAYTHMHTHLHDIIYIYVYMCIHIYICTHITCIMLFISHVPGEFMVPFWATNLLTWRLKMGMHVYRLVKYTRDLTYQTWEPQGLNHS